MMRMTSPMRLSETFAGEATIQRKIKTVKALTTWKLDIALRRMKRNTQGGLLIKKMLSKKRSYVARKRDLYKEREIDKTDDYILYYLS